MKIMATLLDKRLKMIRCQRLMLPALVYLSGTMACPELFAHSTNYYVVVINGTQLSATTVESISAEDCRAGSVTTHIEGLESMTYTYWPVAGSTTDYDLIITEPPHLSDFRMQVRRLTADERIIGSHLGLFSWLEHSPAISVDGRSLQLPVFNLVSSHVQPSNSEQPNAFRGTLPFFEGGFETDPIQLLTNSDFVFVQMDFPNFRMTRIWYSDIQILVRSFNEQGLGSGPITR